MHITRLSMLFFVLFSALSLNLSCNKIDFTPKELSLDTPSDNPDISETKFVETFTQGEQKSKLDVLFVVDNSPSMVTEQQKLSTRLSSFLHHLKEVDWHIGITTTDVSKGPYGIKGHLIPMEANIEYITPLIPDYNALFLKTIQRNESKCTTLDTCPSSTEEPLKAILLNLEKYAPLATETQSSDDNSKKPNDSFLRKEADFAVVVISDEDEMSVGAPNATKPKDVINGFTTWLGPTKSASVYGIIVNPNDENCLDEQSSQSTSAHFGTYVHELAMETKGFTNSICDNDYGDGLKKIGERIKTLTKNLTLQQIPQENSLEIETVPHVEGLRWEVHGNQVVFNSPPPKGTQIRIKYHPSPSHKPKR